MQESLKILSLNLSSSDVEEIAGEFKKHSFKSDLITINDPEEFKKIILQKDAGLILCNIDTGFPAEKALKYTNTNSPRSVFFALTNGNQWERGIKLIKSGADNCVNINKLHIIPALYKELVNSDSSFSKKSNLFCEALFSVEIDYLLNIRSKEILKGALKEFAEGLCGKARSYFLSILENMPFIITLKDAESLEYIFANNALKSLTGISPTDIIGKTEEEAFKANGSKLYKDTDRNLFLTDDKLIVDEELLRTKAKKSKLLLTRKTLIKDENGKSKFILSVSEDITRRRQNEKDLEYNKSRFMELFRATPIGMVFARVHDRSVIDINNAGLKLLGYRRDDMLGKKIDDMNIWNSAKNRNEILQLTLENGSVSNYETSLISSEGKQITVLLSVEYFMLDESDPWLIFMAMDISDKIKATDEYKTALSKEKELNQLKSRLISMISHELRTPLTTIMLSSDMIKRYGDKWGEEEKNKHFDRIQATIYKMTQLMENVIILGKLESGEFDFHPESVDLPSFCKTYAENITFNSDKEANINFIYDGGCDGAMIDENLLGLIISNLLNNAIIYSAPGERIEFKLFGDKDKARFIIKDCGIGIPDVDKNHIFESFFRGSNSGTISGYGLGLNIALKCASRHNGAISFVSSENSGTIFTVELPIS